MTGTVYVFVAEGIAEQAAYLKNLSRCFAAGDDRPERQESEQTARLQEQLDNLEMAVR